MSADPEDIQGVYDRQAAVFDAQRSRALFEARWLARFAAALPGGARVLDLGCGTGDPIARWFKAEGFVVTGVDFSEPMLAIARERWPEGDWRQADMRVLDLGETFDGIIAWNSFFHLTADAQRGCIAHMAAHLEPGGSLMLTVGPSAGEGDGTVGNEPVYHASLSPAEYATCLDENDLRLTGFLAEDPDANGHTVLMARKI
ncbi:class I SAM-dependent DNA methyltransferase [Tateyamaria omphalii]|uniref:SAM-dependent methyltransferase n=1 Tax=Tateyamaria omphalii TaxID=299262 RepID=A0A1P8MS02_9RHOB|nr:class I SAM-dependent methyltransferase [Tateyamaria omphalii]APX10831.1 SAM-dependent methyltransferase [Tateyamaria omphalii]